MWGILHVRVTSLVAVVVPRTGKIIRKRRICYKMVYFIFVFTLSQSPKIVLQR